MSKVPLTTSYVLLFLRETYWQPSSEDAIYGWVQPTPVHLASKEELVGRDACQLLIQLSQPPKVGEVSPNALDMQLSI